MRRSLELASHSDSMPVRQIATGISSNSAMTCALSGMNCCEPLPNTFIQRFTEPDGQLDDALSGKCCLVLAVTA